MNNELDDMVTQRDLEAKIAGLQLREPSPSLSDRIERDCAAINEPAVVASLAGRRYGLVKLAAAACIGLLVSATVMVAFRSTGDGGENFEPGAGETARVVPVSYTFEEHIPDHTWLRSMPSGEVRFGDGRPMSTLRRQIVRQRSLIDRANNVRLEYYEPAEDIVLLGNATY